MLYQNFLKTIEENGLFEAGDNLVVGVSGGVDSVVLLHLLLRLRDELGVFLHVVHVNYKMRGKDSDGDEYFVRELCENKSIPFFRRRVDLSNERENFQLEARNFRLDFFARIAGQLGADAIVLGQHLDDQVETVLMHLVRGCGVAGLRGIEIKSNYCGVKLIRPLIAFSKNEIFEFAEKNKIEWREDVSNEKLIYTRNIMRHKLISVMKEINPKVEEAIFHLSRHAKEDDDALSKFADEFSAIFFHHDEREISFDRDEYLKKPISIRKRILILAYTKLRGNKEHLSGDHIERMDHIARRETHGKEYSLPGNFHFLATADLLIIRNM
ncbi:MAG: tRNA lysidine(34) synthetase TilS [Pseudomonadota bacterium]